LKALVQGVSPLPEPWNRRAVPRNFALGSGETVFCGECGSGPHGMKNREDFVAIGDSGTALATDILGRRKIVQAAVDPTKSAFFWLSGFYVVYCARPEDWIPGLSYIPLAKVTAILALWGLFNAMGRTKRTLKDVPLEGKLLLAMIGLLFVGAFLSPVWRGGAVSRTIDFSKVYIAWILTFLLITSFRRLKQIIYIQTASVAVICFVSVIKGHNTPRLDGVLGGIYSNPNDLAFSIVLTLPFALAFLLTSRTRLRKMSWIIGMFGMGVALVLTASRAGFISLIISGTVTLWHFGVRGRRLYLIVATGLIGTLLLVTAGGKLYDRFAALSGDSTTDKSAYASYQDRKYLMERSLEGIEHYPILGIGIANFQTYSLIWHDVHMTYLQICVEGGIPVLILYLLFIGRAFKNLRVLRKAGKQLDHEMVLFVAALHSSLIGFVIGALFAPEAYQYFPYFTVAFTAVLLQIYKDQATEPGPSPIPKKPRHFLEVYGNYGRAGAITPVR
jgi:putative inorganic carbon (hco3(-)) transporter